MSHPVRRKGRGEAGGHRPRKRFSQNFLVDPNTIERIVTMVAPLAGERVVEIGPGRGAITELLVQQVDDLVVIEIDRDLVAQLATRFAGLRIITADALRVRYDDLFEGSERFRVVGNLPYNISTPLLFHLMAFARHIEDAHFMLQEEVVDRITAAPGEKAWGRLGVMIQYHCKVERLFSVSPEAFTPKPQVRSRILRLEPHRELPFKAHSWKLFDQVVRAAFSQRRKTLRNALKSVPGIELLPDLGIDFSARPETLSVEDFVHIGNALAKVHDPRSRNPTPAP